MTSTVVSVIGMDICAVTDRIVSQWKLQCCRMVITICQLLMKLFPPTWQHHHLTIASTTIPIIRWEMSLIAGVDQYGGQVRELLDFLTWISSFEGFTLRPTI